MVMEPETGALLMLRNGSVKVTLGILIHCKKQMALPKISKFWRNSEVCEMVKNTGFDERQSDFQTPVPPCSLRVNLNSLSLSFL